MLPNDYADVAAAAAALSQERDRVAAICVAVQQIAAPTDHEEERAAWVRARFDALGLSDVHVDAHRNVHARVPGRDAAAPALLVSAHTDTVFPAHTDLSVRHDAAEDRIYGPGIGDNSTGVAALLVALAHAFILPFKPTVRRRQRLELVVQYWHFVDVLWVYLIMFFMVQS